MPLRIFRTIIAERCVNSIQTKMSILQICPSMRSLGKTHRRPTMSGTSILKNALGVYSSRLAIGSTYVMWRWRSAFMKLFFCLYIGALSLNTWKGHATNECHLLKLEAHHCRVERPSSPSALVDDHFHFPECSLSAKKAVTSYKPLPQN